MDAFDCSQIRYLLYVKKSCSYLYIYKKFLRYKRSQNLFAVFFLDYPVTPELDIVFAINTAASDADNTFKLLKDAVKSIVDKYSPDKIRYSVIVFDDSQTSVVSFTKDPQDVKKLIRIVDRMPQPSGLPDFKELLEKAKDVFRNDSGRPQTNKILVVLTDSESPTTSTDIKEASKVLWKDEITVIGVAVGPKANLRKLEKMTPDKRSPLNASKDMDPNDLGDKIMKEVLEGWYTANRISCFRKKAFPSLEAFIFNAKEI